MRFVVFLATGMTMGFIRSYRQVSSKILLKATSSWNNLPYESYPKGAPELTVLQIIIPPFSSLPWHLHAMPNAAYILNGTLTVEDHKTGKTHLYRKGQAFAESVQSIHRGKTGWRRAVVIVTYAGEKGQILSQMLSTCKTPFLIN